jgi:hypothetical protein
MNLKPTIDGFVAALQEAIDQDRLLTLQSARLLRELERLRTARVGVRETIREVQGELYRMQSQAVRYEATSADCEIARMKGYELEPGKEISFAFKSLLRGVE